MKKVFFILVIACLFMSFLNAADKVKVRQEVQVNDRDPFAGNHPYGTPPTDDLFDLQFDWPVGVGGGEAGIETDGTYMYTTKWNGGTFFRYNMDGTFIEEFAVTGCPGSIRDLAYDGTYFYGAAATNTVYEMDFDTQTVISTITAPIAVRAIAYDPVNDGFWGNNWSDSITLFDRNGTTLDSFPCGVFQSYYGFAWENVLDGGPYLWGYSQDGPTLNQLVQFDIATGLETGVNFDIGSITAVGTGIAGGMCISDAFVAGTWTICGTAQNVNIWGVELGPSAPPESPGAPTDFAVIPDAGGALEATIAWTCPTLQVNGDPLTDLDEMRVYRGEDLIYTDTAPVIGGPAMYIDMAVPASGTYTYKAVGFNDFGEGIPASGTTWVGEDVPNVVENLLLEQTLPGALSGTLTWDNPTTGLNGGAFNNAILGYHIVRSDGVILEPAGIATTYVDNTVPFSGNYNYTVQAYNSIGDGGTATSNWVLIADPGLLIYEDFTAGVPPAGWYVDGLGQGNWASSATANAGGTSPEMILNWSPSFVGISRMCTNTLNTVGMLELSLEFKHNVNDFSGGYTLGVATTSDGVTWNTAWSIVPNGAIPATTETVIITTPDVGSANFQMCFFLDGDSFNINYWYIDDCILSGPPAVPDAPGSPSDVTFITDPAGALELTAAWTCPTLTVIGDPLTELLEMRVYRDAVLIYTDTAPIIGGPGMYVDVAVPAAGFYDYSVVGYNSEGEGIPFAGTPWVGEDVPDTVTDLTLTDVSTDDLAAQLDWVNPTGGLHGGYFAGCTGYDVERSDGVVFQIIGSATQWIDDTIPEPGIYSYALTPFNNSGPGPTSTTAQVGIGVSLIQIGNQEIEDYQIPINLWYMDSMTECIYLQEWIGTDMLINTISYHANTISTLNNDYYLEIWLGITQETDLSAGWIDGSQLTQVFAGMTNVPPGDSWVDIPFDTSFEYDYSGNLVVMVIRDDDEYYTTSDFWWCTESGTPFRTRHAYNDNSAAQHFNATTGPFTSTYEKSLYPDLRFYYSVLAHGDVEGIVTDAVTTNPIEGVEVFVGTWGPATTNAAGEYLLEDLVTGMQDVNAFKAGYYNYQGQVEVLPSVIVQHDIVMNPHVFGTLDGTVTDAENGAPLVGAQIDAISEGGYEYDAVTNDVGYYFIDNMVAETYDVTCAFPNYPTEMVEDVVIAEGLTTTIDFALEGYAYWCDFETNDGGLISDNPSGWQWGAFTSGPMAGYSGTNGWATVIGGDYPNGANFTLDTPVPFFIESPLAELEFWHWYDIENGFDGGNVKISTDGGTSWSVIIPLTGYTGLANTANPLNGEEIFCGSSAGWEFLEFDLSPYISQSVMFRWHFGSDASVQYPGWYIDDVSISGASTPDPGWLAGIVTEFGTGTPIEGAVVSIVGSGLSATTLADGTYEITAIWPGDYDITCEAPLYLPAEELGYTIVTGPNILDFILLWSEISVDVTELVSNLPPDDTEVQTFIITNDGPGELEYDISFDFPAEVRVRNGSGISNVSNPRENVNSSEYTKTSKNASNVRKELSSNDRDQNASNHSHGVPPTDDLFDLQFDWPVGVGGGEAGIETDGTYMYTTKWNGTTFFRYAMDGTFIEEFAVTGCPGAIRDLAYDGQYFYGAAATNTVYEMDFDTQTVISTITAPIAVRAIAYDEASDGFWANNWSDTITLFDRNGTTLDSFPCGVFLSYYGFAWENVLPGGPYLWGYSQDGPTLNQLVQFDIATGLETGVNFDVGSIVAVGTGIAGGMCISDAFVPGKWTICGTAQNVNIWGVELADAVNWVMITDNISATVPGNGGSIVVEVTFDATELTVGEILTADLLIHNNSNYGDDYIIPVTLNVVSVGTEEDPPVLYTKLGGNYPNPFNPETAINFAIHEAGKVRIDVFNIKGQLVKTLVNEHLEAAYHSVIWNGKDTKGVNVSSGVYFYKMDAAKYTSTKKMILMK